MLTLYVARVKLIGTLLIRAVSDCLEVPIFSTSYHNGLPNIKISEAPMGTFVLADEETTVRRVVCKIFARHCFV